MQKLLTQEMTGFYNCPDMNQIPLLSSDPCGSYNPKITFGVGYRLPYRPMNKLARENIAMNPMVKAARKLLSLLPQLFCFTLESFCIKTRNNQK